MALDKIVKVIPLGGLGEIGKNTMAISCGNDIILVDAGLAFPSDDLIGVELVLPDISYLVENQEKIRGLAITHGHEDHIGGVPFILNEVSIPAIYGPALALGLLESKLSEMGLEDRTQLKKVKPRQRVRMGCFEVEFIRCTHSIADSFSLIIRTPIGNLVHTGDFKFDLTPVDGELFDFASLARASDEGILLLMSDSTNTERPGYTPSERTVWGKLNEVFARAQQRIIVTTFASNVHRVRQVLLAAMHYGRKVSILGRSMHKFAELSRELGYMKFPDNLLIPIEQIRDYPDNQVVILTTGSQGEPLSALTRIANNEHKFISIVPGDTVIISATPIPGNERSIANTINKLFLRGADVVYGKGSGIHVSGHACQEEQKLMLNLCTPKYFMPIHGEYRMLVKHCELAEETGVLKENTFVLKNGEVLELTKNSCTKNGIVKSGVILIDSNREWRIDYETVDDRQHLSQEGLVMVVTTMGSDGKILAGPDISIRGIILPQGVPAEEFVLLITKEVETLLTGKKRKWKDEEHISLHIQDGLEVFLQKRMNASPLVQVKVNLVSVKDEIDSDTERMTSGASEKSSRTQSKKKG